MATLCFDKSNGIPTFCVPKENRIAKTCEVDGYIDMDLKDLSLLPQVFCEDVGFCLGKNPINDNENSLKISFSYIDNEASKMICLLIENIQSTCPKLTRFHILVVESQQLLKPAEKTKDGVPRAFHVVIDTESDLFYNTIKNFSKRCVV